MVSVDYNMDNREQKKELNKAVLIFALIVVAITSIPYLIGYQLSNDEFVFSGFVFGVDDGNSYIAKMLLGAKGDWLFRSPYTSMEQNGLFAFFPYILLGKLAGGVATHEQLLVLFQLFRVAGVFFLCFSYFKFFCLFF